MDSRRGIELFGWMSRVGALASGKILLKFVVCMPGWGLFDGKGRLLAKSSSHRAALREARWQAGGMQSTVKGKLPARGEPQPVQRDAGRRMRDAAAKLR